MKIMYILLVKANVTDQTQTTVHIFQLSQTLKGIIPIQEGKNISLLATSSAVLEIMINCNKKKKPENYGGPKLKFGLGGFTWAKSHTEALLN